MDVITLYNLKILSIRISVALFGKKSSLCYRLMSTLSCYPQLCPIPKSLLTGLGKNQTHQLGRYPNPCLTNIIPVAYSRTKKKDIYVISTLKRPVPLEHHLYAGKEFFKVVGAHETRLNGTE